MDERRQQYGQQRGEGGFGRRDNRDTGQRGPSQEIVNFKEAIASKRFIDDEVMRQSEKLAEKLTERIDESKKENSLTQVRKFYNQVKVVQQQANAENADFNTLKPKVRLLQAQAAYSVARGLLTGDFKVFFDAAAEKIIKEGKEALNEFAEFFQAVYAHFYFHTKTGGSAR